MNKYTRASCFQVFNTCLCSRYCPHYTLKYLDPCGIIAPAWEEKEVEEEEEEEEEEPPRPPPPLSPPPPPPRLEATNLRQAVPRVSQGDVPAREGEEEEPPLPPPSPPPPPTLSPPASDVSAPGSPPTSPARAPRAAAAAAMKKHFKRGPPAGGAAGSDPAERDGLRPRSSRHRLHCCRRPGSNVVPPGRPPSCTVRDPRAAAGAAAVKRQLNRRKQTVGSPCSSRSNGRRRLNPEAL
ncbi:formin-like protein 5 isoform X2 [Prionailurus viverrinus]|uniref:formin-like protein 5 isoform X3 n=1 Tax=Prionailurus viverrinus TaxID=61388 RepID=UPI001FF2BC1D|nr:formin-like protein 5 isoform X3 [Prionailurus viverrinus]XP_047695435.1 formin-like protein 5 isoform X3 [Prionailurus viverrinus]XP_047695436.1 formin-like protein 5 isoform X3 [Prionailurus viverrinus]XP_047695440.1 formin-like protein 5 isoform X2 [Prionailurus viverrinus]XP_047695441.1 formin-like protein 5 isoform X2 [Prionailurus viverrinus]XP_047695442.1 formin-like protein 5 isoform X2 [Prionailurus viverrinus]XP_047695443.1 formin-like protein 5 isoform X2 [Prionailurus viverrinu